LRRRVGIPMAPSGSGNSARSEVLMAGLGLGGIFYGATHLDALVGPRDLPPAPSTALDQLVPLVAGIADIPSNAIGIVLIPAIPILLVAGLTPRRSWRALI